MIVLPPVEHAAPTGPPPTAFTGPSSGLRSRPRDRRSDRRGCPAGSVRHRRTHPRSRGHQRVPAWSPIAGSAQCWDRELVVGEHRERDESSGPGDVRHDEPVEVVEHCPCNDFAERAVVALIGAIIEFVERQCASGAVPRLRRETPATAATTANPTIKPTAADAAVLTNQASTPPTTATSCTGSSSE